MFNNWQKCVIMSSRPVPNPKFTHQSESYRTKSEISFLTYLFVFCLLSNSDVIFNVSVTEYSIIGKQKT